MIIPERGLSGVWVLQQLRLIGIIVAVYEREPYAHMLQISQIVCDIKNSVCLPARASSPDLEVELPKTSTGELLSASKKDSEDG